MRVVGSPHRSQNILEGRHGASPATPAGTLGLAGPGQTVAVDRVHDVTEEKYIFVTLL